MDLIRMCDQFKDCIDRLTGASCEVDLFDEGPDLSEASRVMYSDGMGSRLGILLVDKALVTGIGAALSMMPQDQAAAALEGPVPDDLWECFTDVVTLASSAFNDDEVPALMDLAVRPGEDASEEVREWLRSSSEHAHFEVHIPGYPGGRMTAYVPGLPSEQARDQNAAADAAKRDLPPWRKKRPYGAIPKWKRPA